LGDILHDGAAWIDIDSDRMWRDIDEVPAGSNTDIAGSGLNNGLLTPVDPKDPDMLASILATKLYLPPLRPNAVRRPRLIERLSNGLLQGRSFARKLTLVSAPAGFGKTTLLSAWIETLASASEPVGPRFAWLSLDEDDGDPIRFLAYLAAAVRTVAPDTGLSVLAALEASQPPPVEALLAAWLNELAALAEPVCLVLDDYHALDARPVDEALAFLIDHLPPQLHLVIATREDPDLPLPRLRARGQLVELRAADLLFTTPEAADFLNQMMGLGLTDEAITALGARTEGWAAGLQLAALVLQSTPDGSAQGARDHLIRSFTGSHHFVLDYLLEEVLNRQPQPIQAFLLRTSILERMCAPLSEAVVQDPSVGGQETLEYLERANLFTIPLDGERRWYRYHKLFGDLLRQRLGQDRQEARACHRRASRWYVANGDPTEAFQHAVAADEMEEAASIAELAWHATFRSYRQNAVFLNWMKALPEDVIRARPVLSAGYAWALLDFGQLEAAEPRLLDAERGLDSAEAERVVADMAEFTTLPATLALARATLSLAQGNAPDAVGHAQRALTTLPADDFFRGAGAAAMLGAAYLLMGNLEASAEAIVEGMDRVKKSEQPGFALSGIPVLADLRRTQGRLREAADLYQQALHETTPPDAAALPGAADMALGLCELALERNDLSAAEQYLQQSLALGEAASLPGWGYQLSLSQARLSEIAGDFESALGHLQEAEQLYFPTAVPEMRPVTARRARLWIKQRRIDAALDWAQRAGLATNDVLVYPREFEHVTLARALMAPSRNRQEPNPSQEVVALLEHLSQAAEAGGRSGSLIEILTLKALALHARGRVPQAMAALHQALALAAPEGILRVFIDEGEAMRAMLAEYGVWRNRQAGQPEPADDHAYRLEAFFARAGSPSAPQPGLVEALSDRELEVLRLIALGLSNGEIAARLCVAVNTVKGHNLRIFGKLGAKTRTAATARARDLRLL